MKGPGELKSLPPKTCVISCLLRYYDFVNSVELAIIGQLNGNFGDEKSKPHKPSKAEVRLLKQISLGKQKLIFYMSYMKGNYFNFEVI